MATELKPFLPPSETPDEFDLESRDQPPHNHQWAAKSRNKRSIVHLIATFTIAILLGILIGHNYSSTGSSKKPQESQYGGLLPPDGNSIQVWQHDLIFSQAPTPESEAAWDAMIPPGRGFIHQPEIAPFISNIAAFHQLHCLHSILTVYYASISHLEYVLAHPDMIDDYEPKLYGAKMSALHTRHCFDYLRRSIMCAADTNLEVLDRVKHTTDGWGQEKICRDWDSVVEYAFRWRNSSDTGIVTGERTGEGFGS